MHGLLYMEVGISNESHSLFRNQATIHTPAIFVNNKQFAAFSFYSRVSDLKMSSRTYGDKPIQFQLEENGEYYCVGSEVRENWI